MNATLARLTRLTAGPQPPGDGPLLDAFLAGDQEAFAVLVRRHAGLVFATCRRVLRHQQDAEDAFQATFLVLARRAADVWPREAVASWLFGVAHRVALKARAARNRRLTREQPLQEVAGEEPARPDFDSAELVHRVIAKLPEVYRAAVVACDLEGLSRKEAAERLGWSEGTLSGRLARARELLAHRLRRHGVSLTAGGLATFAATECASAEIIQCTIELATGAAAIAPPAVVALTEGVVRSMGLLKLKIMAAAVVAACALGWGAFAASGAGAGDKPGAQKTQPRADAPPTAKPADPPPKAAVPKGPRVELAQQELRILLVELEAREAAGQGNLSPDQRAVLRNRIEVIARLLDEDGGRGEKPPEKPAKPVTDRDRLQGSWRVVSLTEGGKTMLTNPKDPWAVEVSGTSLKMPYLEGGKEWKHRAFSFGIDEKKTPREITLFAANKPVGRGIYQFTAPARTCQSCHMAPSNPAFGGGQWPRYNESYTEWLGLCDPALKNHILLSRAYLRLAISIDGKRPEKFGGPGVIVFDLHRTAEAATLRAPADAQRELDRLAVEVERAEVDAQTAKLVLDETVARLEKLKRVAEKAQLDWAEANTRRQRIQKEYERAKERWENKAPRPAKAGEVFTVHVRPLTAEEKVIRVKATGKESVLEGLTYAAEDMAIKSDAVSVWVVRDKAILPVDLGAIRKGEVRTNYALKPGDQLFVQSKPNP